MRAEALVPISCPCCDRRLVALASGPGKWGRCPGCGTVIELGGLAPSVEDQSGGLMSTWPWLVGATGTVLLAIFLAVVLGGPANAPWRPRPAEVIGTTAAGLLSISLVFALVAVSSGRSLRQGLAEAQGQARRAQAETLRLKKGLTSIEWKARAAEQQAHSAQAEIDLLEKCLATARQFAHDQGRGERGSFSAPRGERGSVSAPRRAAPLSGWARMDSIYR